MRCRKAIRVVAVVAAVLSSSCGSETDRVATEEWQQLFDHTTLEGWRPTGGGSWVVRDGILIGLHGEDDRQYGHLISDSTYADFLVRIRFKILKGNSGFYFRMVREGDGGVSGLQAEISKDGRTGGLWETNGRGWVSLPREEEVALWFRPDDWNELVIRAEGKKVKVWTNDMVSATFTDDDPRFPGWQDGHLAVQLHGNEDVEIWISSIEIQGI